MASSTADEKSGTEVLRLTYSPPEAPMLVHVPSTACEVISLNGQGQLCPLTCAE